jgi:carbonic anhydrase
MFHEISHNLGMNYFIQICRLRNRHRQHFNVHILRSIRPDKQTIYLFFYKKSSIHKNKKESALKTINLFLIFVSCSLFAQQAEKLSGEVEGLELHKEKEKTQDKSRPPEDEDVKAKTQNVSPSEVLGQLKLGNQRFFENRPQHLDDLIQRRHELEAGQHPICTIITCSDSRVTPEIIFDQPLSKLFVIRVAGNVMTEGVIETLSFAVRYLKTPLIVVMGHEKCGLIQAIHDDPHNVQLESLVAAALPYVKPNMTLDEAIKSNAHGQTDVARTVLDIPSESIRAAYYNQGTGKVTFYDAHKK